MLTKVNHAQSHAYNAQVRPIDGDRWWRILTMVPGLVRVLNNKKARVILLHFLQGIK
jgi:hypothetical protein